MSDNQHYLEFPVLKVGKQRVPGLVPLGNYHGIKLSAERVEGQRGLPGYISGPYRRSPVTDTVTTRRGGGRRLMVLASTAATRFFRPGFILIPLGLGYPGRSGQSRT